MTRQTIVIAWADLSGLVATGRMVRPDGVNYRPEMRPDWRGHACVWVLDGDADDLTKAEAHAATIGGVVYTFPTREPDPLGKARDLVLTEVRTAAKAPQ